MRRSTSTPSRAMSASSSRSRTGRRSATTCRSSSTCSRPGEYLGEEYYRAGGLPAVMHELLEAGRIHGDALTINGKTVGENVAQGQGHQRRGHPPLRQAAEGAGRLQGAARQSVRFRDHEDERDLRGVSQRYLSDPKDPNAFEGRAVVFDGPEDYHRRIDDPALAIDERTHPVHARRRADRLSGLGRGGEHAAAGGADQARHHFAALHRRRPPIGNVGLALDPQRLAGSGGRRRACAAQDRRSRPHRSQQGHRRHSDLRRRSWRRGARR